MFEIGCSIPLFESLLATDFVRVSVEICSLCFGLKRHLPKVIKSAEHCYTTLFVFEFLPVMFIWEEGEMTHFVQKGETLVTRPDVKGGVDVNNSNHVFSPVFFGCEGDSLAKSTSLSVKGVVVTNGCFWELRVKVCFIILSEPVLKSFVSLEHTPTLA